MKRRSTLNHNSDMAPAVTSAPAVSLLSLAGIGLLFGAAATTGQEAICFVGRTAKSGYDAIANLTKKDEKPDPNKK